MRFVRSANGQLNDGMGRVATQGCPAGPSKVRQDSGSGQPKEGIGMATTEERLTQLEVRVEEHATTSADLRELIVTLDQKMDRRFDAMEERFDRRFFWIIAIQFGIFAVIITGLFGVITKLL